MLVFEAKLVSSIPKDFFIKNPIKFCYFMALFTETVEKKVDNPRRKLMQLIKNTIGGLKKFTSS